MLPLYITKRRNFSIKKIFLKYAMHPIYIDEPTVQDLLPYMKIINALLVIFSLCNALLSNYTLNSFHTIYAKNENKRSSLLLITEHEDLAFFA